MVLISESPFPFTKLPVEIRTEIYKYAAASDDIPRKFTIKSAIELQKPPPQAYFGDLKTYLGDLRDQETIAQPGLFQTCSQIYHESRVFFYRHHEFQFYIWHNSRVMSHQTTKRHPTCLEMWFRWFDAIGVDMQKQIRTLDFSLTCFDSACQTYVRFIEDLHPRLSDRATVIYRGLSICPPKERALLSGLADAFQNRDTTRAPHLDFPTLPVGQEYVRTRDLDPSLTFGPGAGWFGRNL